MGRSAKTVGRNKQGTVQLLGFAVELNRATARGLAENNKITASAAVLAFSRLSPLEQADVCAETRKRHAATRRPGDES